MNTMPGPMQSASFLPSFLVKPPVEIRPDELKNEQFQSGQPSFGKRATLAFARHLIVFFTGVAATLAWQTYGDVSRKLIARGASAPDQQQNAMSLDLDEMRRSIGGLAISIGSAVASSQERTTRSVDQLAVRLEQMAREIAKLQAVEQYVLYKNSEPSPGSALAQVPKRVPRPPQATIAR